jgi:hypothetical protein
VIRAELPTAALGAWTTIGASAAVGCRGCRHRPAANVLVVSPSSLASTVAPAGTDENQVGGSMIAVSWLG